MGDRAFFWCLSLMGGAYVLLLVAMLAADACYTTPGHLLQTLTSPEIRYATILSLISCTLAALLSV